MSFPSKYPHYLCDVYTCYHTFFITRELYKSSEYEQCLGCILQALEIYPENTALQAFALQVHAKKEG